MDRKNKKIFWGSALMALFVIFTLAVSWVDVRPIGPLGSEVGLAGINGQAANAIGLNLRWYDLTELMGYGVLLVAAGFCVFGLVQMIRRKSLRMDRDLWVLAGTYVFVGIVYVLFEKLAVNYRPVILEEGLEPSYPSSHTILSLCILGTAMVQFRQRISCSTCRRIVLALCGIAMAAIVIGRLLSGVHWLTDIIGSVIFSYGVVLLYSGIAKASE